MHPKVWGIGRAGRESPAPVRRGHWSRKRRVAAALALAVGCGAGATVEAQARTLKLVFPDGKPMTYGSACAGLGCLDRNDRVAPTDDRGEVRLPDAPRTIEYRRDGINLAGPPVGAVSGTTLAVTDAVTVVLPRLLIGSAPAVDASESEVIARINDARAAQGLPVARLSPQLSTASDMQATWLSQSGVMPTQSQRFHVGPFGSEVAFRHAEVSLPDAWSGAEVAGAAGTAGETVEDWLGSALHRSLVLAPGPMIIGAARVGVFTIVETHEPCTGCEQPVTPPPPPPPPPPVAPPAAPATRPPPPPPAAATSGSSTQAQSRAACLSEQLATQRLRKRAGRVRLRIVTHCLRKGARYVLMVRQGTRGRLLRTVRIKSAGSTMLRLRPTRGATRLGIRLKRDGHVIVGRMLKLR